MASKNDRQATPRGPRRVMLAHLRNLSLKHKLVALIMLTCVPALLLAGGVFVVWEWTSLRHAMIRDVSAQAKIIAQNCQAAVAFKDREDASAVLRTLDTLPSIVAACICSKDEPIFSSYVRDGFSRSLVNLDLEHDGAAFTNGDLIVQVPIILDGERIGTLALCTDLTALHRRVEHSLIVIFGILLASAAAAYLLSSRLQRIISQPILDLANVAHIVAEKKQYTVRAEQRGNDEVGLLIRSFNEMLEQIRLRDAALVEANENLESRVQERTAELSSANVKLEEEIVERQKAQSRLAYLASFPERNPCPVMEVGLDANIRYTNPATLRLFPDLPERGLAHPCLAEWEAAARRFREGQTDTSRRDVTIGQRIYEQSFHYFAQDGFVRIYTADITERKHAEQALRESEARFRSLVEQAGDGFELLDAQGRFVDMNSATCRLLGYTKDELLHLSIQDVDPAVSREQYAATFPSLAGQPPKTLESLHRRKDGTTFPVEVTFSIIQLGGVPRSLALARDITERKRAEEQQAELLRQVQRANQELKDFIYTLSHDLRAPAQKIVSFGQLLQEALANKLTDDDKENLEFMIGGAGRMHELIDALLVYSRVSTKEVRFDALDLNQIMDELKSVELAVPLEESNGAISIPEPLPTAQGDRVQIRQLLQNLVSNGLKYHRKGVLPQVTIRAQRQDNGIVRVEVQDNGIGIEQQYHDKLFVMFRRLHSNDEYEGTGIGLAVCKKIIERHKGQIGIASTPGEGSTFWFTLPVPKDRSERKMLLSPSSGLRDDIP